MTLEATTPSDTEIQVVRRFNAPRQLLWDAHTKPELVKKWLLGPPGWSMPECDIDLRVGGAYRYKWVSDENGAFFTSSGVHKEVIALERIVTTETMDLTGLGMEIPPGESVNTLTLSETGGQTTLTVRMRFPSKAHRDGALQSGMTGGMEQSYQRLEEEIL
ncbi:MAG TPA: SRPBCC family protein [Terricaulis sp.]|nr:SRPBCC family protein [Terricaulis sp.]HRP12276.1 SRPBCC family protein [Terricaulis sp.]